MEKQFTSPTEKEEFVQGVFSKVAKRYDLMNTLLSFHMDSYWRRLAVQKLELAAGNKVLDVACGTCMLTLEALEQAPHIQVDALDFNADMLAIGENKVREAGLADSVTFLQGDAMNLPYETNSFDMAMSAFAMRNVPDVKRMLSEMYRVVKPGGKVMTLELAKPSLVGFKQLYYLYFERLLPLVGKLGSRDSAYLWLPESLRQYPHQEEIYKLYQQVGYKKTTYFEMTGGIVAVHVGEVN